MQNAITMHEVQIAQIVLWAKKNIVIIAEFYCVSGKGFG